MNKSDRVRRFIFNAGATIVSVRFIKKDGTLRCIQFNPRDTKEIKGTGTASKPPSIIRCRDFSIAKSAGSGAWRSFDCERVVSISAKGVTLKF